MSPAGGESSGQRFYDLVRDDPLYWYQKPNLRSLYLFLVPAAMGVEWTSGFDGSIMNGLQAVETWDACMLPSEHLVADIDVRKDLLLILLPDFNRPRGSILGIVGSICSTLGRHSLTSILLL